MAIQFYLLINSRRLSANIEIRNCRFSLQEDAFIIHKNISDISNKQIDVLFHSITTDILLGEEKQ